MKTGTFLFVKDTFYDKFPNHSLCQNKETVNEEEHDRPCFFAFRDQKTQLLWLVPVSSQIDKYQEIYKRKLERNGKCNTIVFGELLGKKKAFLVQNMFPITEKYINNIYFDNNTSKPVDIDGSLKHKIIQNAQVVLSLEKKGVKLLFTDAFSIEKELLKERKENAIAEANLSVREKISKLNENKYVSEDKNEVDKEIDI